MLDQLVSLELGAWPTPGVCFLLAFGDPSLTYKAVWCIVGYWFIWYIIFLYFSFTFFKFIAVFHINSLTVLKGIKILIVICNRYLYILYICGNHSLNMTTSLGNHWLYFLESFKYLPTIEILNYLLICYWFMFDTFLLSLFGRL